MITKRPAATLDGGDLGWLKARHHFRVSAEGNPDNVPLGSLLVWNDDEIAPGTGFPMHGHKDMEIISYIRTGTVTHRDSIGSEGSTSAGDVQVMSAGTGIRHSEHNLGPEPLRVFQIWIRPRRNGIAPRWATRQFPSGERANELMILASGFSSDTGALPIEADARVLGATLAAGTSLTYDLTGFRHAYLAPAIGRLQVGNQILDQGDGLAVTNEDALTITALDETELILVTTA